MEFRLRQQESEIKNLKYHEARKRLKQIERQDKLVENHQKEMASKHRTPSMQTPKLK